VGLEDIESDTGRFIGSTKQRRVKSSTFRFTSKHVLYGRLRPYLNKVLRPDFEGHCSTEIFPLLPTHGTSGAFIQYWLMMDTTVAKINETCTGSRMPRADVEEALGFSLRIPDPPEQERIVAILDEALDGIVASEVIVDKNLTNSRSVFDSSLEARFENGGAAWMTQPLSELCEFKHGFAFKSEYFRSDGEYVLLTPGNFYERGGYRDRGEKQKYYQGDFPKDFLLNSGDLLVAMTEQAAGLLGSPIIVPESGSFLHNQRLGLVKNRPDIPWLNEFFFHAFNTKSFRKAVHDGASGVKVRHTSPTKLGEISISFPLSMEEQQTFVTQMQEVYSDTLRLEAVYNKKLVALRELKQSLLHQAFSGNL
jgi:type I restriction enzyme, S subunit